MMVHDDRKPLSFQVIDRDLGDEPRSVNSLSGGESFLISLALALGLSSTTSHETHIESLFIDEGFGTLDPEALDMAISMLDQLQLNGIQIGIISHVESIAERVGTRLEVKRSGAGKSDLKIHQATPTLWKPQA
jgi:exonuclease SbcC